MHAIARISSQNRPRFSASRSVVSGTFIGAWPISSLARSGASLALPISVSANGMPMSAVSAANAKKPARQPSSVFTYMSKGGAIIAAIEVPAVARPSAKPRWRANDAITGRV